MRRFFDAQGLSTLLMGCLLLSVANPALARRQSTSGQNTARDDSEDQAAHNSSMKVIIYDDASLTLVGQVDALKKKEADKQPKKKKAATYILGDDGTNVCPADSAPIATEKDCKQACRELRFRSWSSPESRKPYGAWAREPPGPGGCWKGHVDSLYGSLAEVSESGWVAQGGWNDRRGAGESGRRPLCKSIEADKAAADKAKADKEKAKADDDAKKAKADEDAAKEAEEVKAEQLRVAQSKADAAAEEAMATAKSKADAELAKIDLHIPKLQNEAAVDLGLSEFRKQEIEDKIFKLRQLKEVRKQDLEDEIFKLRQLKEIEQFAVTYATRHTEEGEKLQQNL